MQLKGGSELQNGKYRIIRVLGQGGFGITYLAENTFFEKKVAIKEFFPKDFCDRDNTSHLTLGTQNNAETVTKLKERFLKEAKNIARLDHPCIVKIHDIFEENNTAYYVMDYIEGENLNEMVKRDGPLSEAKAVEYICKIGEALDYIHSNHMTHFDVKPANIVVRTSEDMPILIDFGLSKQYDAHGDATSTLMQGVSSGYSPIELYNPGSITSFSPQTDIYSLGATLYFLLTGSVPPSASSLISGNESLRIPSSISKECLSLIERSLKTKKNERPKNIEEFQESLSISGFNSGNDSLTNDEFIEKSEKEETYIIQNIGTFEEKKIDKESYEPEEEDSEPSTWDRFVTNISSTNCLIDTYSVSNIRKLCYFFSTIILFVLSIPLGWIFWIVLLNRIRGALKKLFFPNNISDFDYGSDYSVKKCWGILSIPIIVILLEALFIIYTSNGNHSKALKDYVTQFNFEAPYMMMEAQVNSIELDRDNVILFCNSFNPSHPKRQYLNKLNVEMWKPILSGQDSIININGKIKNYIFRFDNDTPVTNDVVIPVTELQNYRELGGKIKASNFLSSYISLENEFTPYPMEDGFILKNVSITTSGIGFDTRQNLKYTFDDLKSLTASIPLDSIGYFVNRYLPLEFPYMLSSISLCTDGITFQIYNNGQPGKEMILYTSDEILHLLKANN